ncbi:MAG: DUF4445 domain-containing protein [Clostridia bacterium]|nr:DUF4445 domain-containing protein [Clostridia bacterium]
MPTLTIIRGHQTITQSFEPGALLDDVLRSAGIDVVKPCGGRGNCKKCAVDVEGNISEPTNSEISARSRLSCQTRLLGDARVTLREAAVMEQIETELKTALAVGKPMQGDYGAAVDIGTTTVALRLYDLHDGRCLRSLGLLNPQSSVAADVMGRIGASLKGQGELMLQQIHTAISSLLDEAASSVGIPVGSIKSLVVTGNTTMLYLFMGYDPAALSHAPFEADHLFGGYYDALGRSVYLPRCMHAFVGADITCAVLAAGQTDQPEISLLCDIGTNGEISLWKDGTLYVTSTAAGPAFEGAGISCGVGSVRGAIDKVWVEDGQIRTHTISDAPAVGICGSGLIDAVAAGLDTGFIDETGAMDDDEFTLAPGCSLTGADIRAVQLAKAAIAAGIQTLLETAGVSYSQVTTLYIAGGFGSHLSPQSAARIGLLPAELVPRVKVIGNAALGGASSLLLDEEGERATTAIAEKSVHVNLGGNPAFNENYMEQMLFPEDE